MGKPWIKLWVDKLNGSINYNLLPLDDKGLYLLLITIARTESPFEGIICWPEGNPVTNADLHELMCRNTHPPSRCLLPKRVDRLLRLKLVERDKNGSLMVRRFADHQTWGRPIGSNSARSGSSTANLHPAISVQSPCNLHAKSVQIAPTSHPTCTDVAPTGPYVASTYDRNVGLNPPGDKESDKDIDKTPPKSPRRTGLKVSFNSEKSSESEQPGLDGSIHRCQQLYNRWRTEFCQQGHRPEVACASCSPLWRRKDEEELARLVGEIGETRFSALAFFYLSRNWAEEIPWLEQQHGNFFGLSERLDDIRARWAKQGGASWDEQDQELRAAEGKSP